MTSKKNCVNIYSPKMKKHNPSFKAVLFFLSLVLVSCSDSRSDGTAGAEIKTVKSSVGEMENQIVWSLELEGNRLSQKTGSYPDFISDGKSLTKDNAKILMNFSSPLYPVFSDFASLDISQVEIKYLDFAGQVAEQIMTFDKESLFSSFAASYRFNCIFFIQDFEKKWKEKWKGEEKIAFDRYILGQPFKNENLLQFPVRFYCNMGHVDVTLYMSSKDSKSLYNLKIEKWENYE